MGCIKYWGALWVSKERCASCAYVSGQNFPPLYHVFHLPELSRTARAMEDRKRSRFLRKQQEMWIMTWQKWLLLRRTDLSHLNPADEPFLLFAQQSREPRALIAVCINVGEDKASLGPYIKWLHFMLMVKSVWEAGWKVIKAPLTQGEGLHGGRWGISPQTTVGVFLWFV